MAASRTTPRRPRAGILVVIALLVLFLAAGGMAGWLGWKTDAEYRAAGDRFLEKLAAGDVDGAYDLLSPARRAALTPEAFRSLAGHHVLRDRGETTRGRSRSWSGFPPERACIRRQVKVADGNWALQLYLVRGAGGWHVESFGLQGPAAVHLADLLEACGEGPLRSAGHAGPPVVGLTSPLSD